MAYALVQCLNALCFSALLLVCALGMSLLLGLMGFINLAHGSFFVLGAYAAVALLAAGVPWLLAIAAGLAAAAVPGLVLERLLFRRFRDRGHLAQVLLTYGLSVLAADAMRAAFGAQIRTPELPESLAGVVFLFDLPFPVYRLVLIGTGLVLAVLLWWGLERTTWGAVVRACTADRGAVETLGIDTGRVLSVATAAAAGLAGLSGALGAGLLAVYPGLDEEVTVLALVTVVIGGVGTFRGTVAGALLVGTVLTGARLLLPEFANAAAYAAMIAVLLLRPAGLVVPELRAV